MKTTLLLCSLLAIGCAPDAAPPAAGTTAELPPFGFVEQNNFLFWTAFPPINFCPSGSTMGTGDFNFDGQTDFYCHSLANGTTTIALGNGTGNSQPSISVVANPVQTGWCYGANTQFGVLDFDGDGLTDFYCHDTYYGVTWVARNLGGASPTFNNSYYMFNGWCGSQATFTFGDFNHDTKADALCYQASTSTVWVATSNGATLTPQPAMTATFCGGSTTQFGLADFDHDFTSDLYCHDFNSGNTTVMTTNAAGTAWNAPASWMTGWCIGQRTFGIGDFDGNGYTDVWCASSAGHITIGLNAGALGPGFLNKGNWATDFCIGGTFRGATGASYPPDYDDFNADGTTDVSCIMPNGDLFAGITYAGGNTFVSTSDMTRSAFCTAGATPFNGRFNYSPTSGDRRTNLACHYPDGNIIYEVSTSLGITGGRGGPVMATPKVSLIYYGHWLPLFQNFLTNFMTSLSGSPWWNVMTRYGVASTYTVTQTNDGAYENGANLNLTTDMQQIVLRATGNQPATDTVYLIVPAGDVTYDGACEASCGTHGSFKNNTQDIKWAIVSNPAFCNPDPSMPTTACLPGANAVNSPNNLPFSDAMVSVMAHETAETVTDPLAPDILSWYEGNAPEHENADMCAWTFGPTATLPNGSIYNVTLNGVNYLLQRILVATPAPYTPYVSYCAMSL